MRCSTRGSALSDISIAALEPSPDPMAAEGDLAEGIAVDSRSPARMAARRFLRHKAAVTGSIVLFIITMAVILAPWIAPYGETQLVGDPRTETINFLPPQSAYWFGTDSIGRDMYSLILWGGRISLFIGFAVAISASIIGTLGRCLRRLPGRQVRRLPHALHGPVPGLPAARRSAGHPAAPGEAGLGGDGLRGDDLDPPDHHPAGDRVVDADGPHRAGPGAVPQGEGVHRGREGAGGHQLAADLPAPHPQLHRADHRGRHVHGRRRPSSPNRRCRSSGSVCSPLT